MNALTDAKQSFQDGAQFAWDSTSLELAQTCLRKYYYTMIRGIQPKNKSVHLIFGGIYASALENFYKWRAEGDSIDEALIRTVRLALTESWDSDRGCPVEFNDDKGLKTRVSLIRTIVWYIEQFANESDDGLCTYHLSSGKPAVELSFTIEVTDDVVLCGHLDRVVTMGDSLYIMDQKAQPLTSTVLTPDGWRTIGDLVEGDFVATQDGSFTTVNALFPQGKTAVYQITFNDNTVVECSINHLWEIGTQFTNHFTTKSFEEILAMKAAKPHLRFHVPLCDPIQHAHRDDLPLDPYLLGALLGDGYLNGNSIQFSSSRPQFARELASKLPGSDTMRKASQFNHSWTIKGGATLAAIHELGLKGKLAATKFIPQSYMTASPEQRAALLNGLLDTDGSWNGNSRIFDSTSLSLVTAVCELTRSLGGNARFRDRKDTCYRASLRLPHLPTGVGKRYMTKIIRIDDAETCCISVSHQSGLYITNNHTVTHNTTGGTVGTYYFKQFSPNNQMSLYSWAGKSVLHSPISGVIIDAAQIAVNFTRFERGITTRSRDQLDEWFESALHTIKLARQAAALDFYPMTLASCGNYGGCPFRSLCATSPAVRENYIKSDFHEHNWDPLKSR